MAVQLAATADIVSVFTPDVQRQSIKHSKAVCQSNSEGYQVHIPRLEELNGVTESVICLTGNPNGFVFGVVKHEIFFSHCTVAVTNHHMFLLKAGRLPCTF